MPEQYPSANPCPMCDKPDAARQGRADWGHDWLCCSDECGYKFRDSSRRWRMEVARAESQYNFAIDRLRRCERALRAALYLEEGCKEKQRTCGMCKWFNEEPYLARVQTDGLVGKCEYPLPMFATPARWEYGATPERNADQCRCFTPLESEKKKQ